MYKYIFTVHLYSSMNFIDRDVRDSTPVIFISIMMFFIPKDLDFLRSYNKDREYKRGNYVWAIVLLYNTTYLFIYTLFLLS